MSKARFINVTFNDHYGFDAGHRINSSNGDYGDHPVIQFRRMLAEASGKVEAALIAVHGEPDPETTP